MCALKPTKEPVFLRKKSTTVRAKVIKTGTKTPVYIRAESTQAGSEGSGQYDYVIHGKPSPHKQRGKRHAEDKAHIIVRDDSRKRCSCKGNGNDGWLCDACRAAQKKRGVWKVLPCASGSENEGCCCGGCVIHGNAKRENAQARFEREVDEWVHKQKMKNARNAKAKHGNAKREDAQARFEKGVDEWVNKQKMKNARNGKFVCNCNRPGGKVCVCVHC